MFARPAVRKVTFFRAIKKAMLPRSSVLEGGMLGPTALFTPLALICAMGLYNANSQGPVYRVSKQGRTSLDYPACKGSSTGISERGNF
jgi:hypothetical protein